MANNNGAGLSGFLLYICRTLLQYKLQSALLIFTVLADIGFDAFFSMSFKYLIDDALIPRDKVLIAAILSALIAGVLLSWFFRFWWARIIARLGVNVLNDLRLKLFRHLQRLSMDFYSRRKVADLTEPFSADLLAFQYAFVYTFPVVVRSIVSMIVYLGLLFYLEWLLALFAAVGLFLSFYGARLLEPRASEASSRLGEAQTGITSSVQENVGAQPVVKAYGLQRFFIRKFEERITGISDLGFRANFLSHMMNAFSIEGMFLFGVLVVAAGAALTFLGRMSVGDLVAFHAVLITLVYSVGDFSWAMPYLIQAASGMRRFRELLDERPQIEDRADAVAIPSFAGEIAFRNVSFRYPGGERDILRDLTFSIRRGTSVAFVGPSGCGKSTVLNLVLRFYDASDGSVAVDGRDVRSITQESLRKQIGVVFQENVLFNTSIRENIRLGRTSATDEEVERAARLAEVHDFIAGLPDGYDTVVGERGSGLSGGQKQRIAIARAILSDSAVLMLDEATSALDPATEEAVNGTLQKVSQGRTVVSITHCLLTATKADRIFVLSEGHLAEEGSHDELLKKNGLYARLWRKQSGFSLDKDRNSIVGVDLGLLRDIPVLQDLDEGSLKGVSAALVTENFAEDRVILQEGEPGEKFFILVRGRVAISKRDESGAQKRIRTLESGDYFGEIALLRNVPRTATVRTLSPCMLVSLSRKHFMDLLSEAPQTRERLEQMILAREPSLAARA